MDPSVTEARNELLTINNVNLVTSSFDRKIYKSFIDNSMFSIAPYRSNCIWAMSCIDSMGMSVPVIAPNIAWFKEIIPDDLLFSTEDEAIKIIKRLSTNSEYWKEKSAEMKKITQSLLPDQIANTFLTEFNKGISKI